MDSVIDKLTEIEQTASAIVAHAEEEKAEIDREYDERRKKFDQKLEEETMVRIERIREGLESDKKHLLTGQEESSRELIASLQEEYTKNHTVYAENILKADHRGVVYGKFTCLQRDCHEDPGNGGKAPYGNTV